MVNFIGKRHRLGTVDRVESTFQPIHLRHERSSILSLNMDISDFFESQLKVGDIVWVVNIPSIFGDRQCRRVYEKYPITDGWDPPTWIDPDTIGIFLESKGTLVKVVFGDRVVWIHERDIEIHR